MRRHGRSKGLMFLAPLGKVKPASLWSSGSLSAPGWHGSKSGVASGGLSRNKISGKGVDLSWPRGGSEPQGL